MVLNVFCGFLMFFLMFVTNRIIIEPHLSDVFGLVMESLRKEFIFDDNDNATVENVKPVYDLLKECGIYTTNAEKLH